MKKLIPFFAIVLLFLAASVAAADCVIPGGINLDNETGVALKEVYIARTGTNEWSQNILETGLLEPGKRGAIPFDRASVSRIWDVKAVDQKGKEYKWERLALYNIYDIKLFKEGKAEYYEIKNAT